MNHLVRIFLGIAIVVVMHGIAKYWMKKDANNAIEPNWHVEKNAVASQSHPLAGFYKEEKCENPWGWAIGPINTNQYYISFCGPGGCFSEGTYRPNTTIYNDPTYEVVDQNTIKMKSKSGWQKVVRCNGRT
jgi:hypothetical protein